MRPVHPAVDGGTRNGIVRPEPSGTMPRGKVAKDRVRFPDGCGVVPDYGNAAMGIHREEIRRVEPVKLPAGINMFMRQFELAEQPHHLLDVE